MQAISNVLKRGRYLLVAALACLTFLPATASAATASSHPHAVVSLSFDDGQETQFHVGDILARYGMHGTFFVNSAMLGSGPWYMTWGQIHSLAARGNEIGGHTLDHPFLTRISKSKAQHEIRQDRINLINHGFKPSSFAYPYDDFNSRVEGYVKQAGYSSGRIVGGVPGQVQTIPPYDPYQVWTAPDLGSHYTLSSLKASVRQAEAAGGWEVFCFHGFDANNNESIPTSLFTQFVAWLHSQPVSIRTIGQVMGGGAPTVKPLPPVHSPAPVRKPSPKPAHKPTPKPTHTQPSAAQIAKQKAEQAKKKAERLAKEKKQKAEKVARQRVAEVDLKLHASLIFKLLRLDYPEAL